MYDFVKLRVSDKAQIQALLNVPSLSFKQRLDSSTGEIEPFPKTANWQGWHITAYHSALLEIRGSLHKYHKGGSNDNDFTLSEVKEAVCSLRQHLGLDPKKAYLINLEFGLNVSPCFTANEILSQVVCYKNTLPISPFQNTDKGFLMDFKAAETYVKLYDKGAHVKRGNLLRFEIKGMRSRYFESMGVRTMSDLTTKRAANVFAKRLRDVSREIIFTDDSLNEGVLSTKELQLYLRMKDPKEWAQKKGRKNSTVRRKERRFVAFIRQHGQRNLYTYLPQAIEEKWQELTKG